MHCGKASVRAKSNLAPEVQPEDHSPTAATGWTTSFLARRTCRARTPANARSQSAAPSPQRRLAAASILELRLALGDPADSARARSVFSLRLAPSSSSEPGRCGPGDELEDAVARRGPSASRVGCRGPDRRTHGKARGCCSARELELNKSSRSSWRALARCSGICATNTVHAPLVLARECDGSQRERFVRPALGPKRHVGTPRTQSLSHNSMHIYRGGQPNATGSKRRRCRIHHETVSSTLAPSTAPVVTPSTGGR